MSTALQKLHIGSKVLQSLIWERILEEWIVVMEEYVAQYNIGKEESQADLPYWWNEWANTGFLAGAVWRLGGLVISESSFRPKGAAHQHPKRCDLRLRLKIGNDEALDCNVEAKQTWPQTAKEVETEKVQQQLQEAEKQLDKLKEGDRGEVGVAVCFIGPALKRPDDVSALSETHVLFDALSKEFCREDQIFVSYQPRGNGKKITTYDSEEDYFYPGVAFVGQQIVWPV